MKSRAVLRFNVDMAAKHKAEVVGQQAGKLDQSAGPCEIIKQ